MKFNENIQSCIIMRRSKHTHTYIGYDEKQSSIERSRILTDNNQESKRWIFCVYQICLFYLSALLCTHQIQKFFFKIKPEEQKMLIILSLYTHAHCLSSL